MIRPLVKMLTKKFIFTRFLGQLNKPSVSTVFSKNYVSEIKSTGNKLGGMSSKYKLFQDRETETILDIYEEKLKYSNLLEDVELDNNSFVGLNLERGKSGVFEIEDLIDVLKSENAEHIFVSRVPSDIKYVDYICITSGKSQRHMQAIAQFVRKVFKEKRFKNDIIPKLEGESSKDWMALDLEIRKMWLGLVNLQEE